MTDKGDIISNLDGTSLRVFLYVLKQKDNIGVRETQKKLSFKSASLAQYHLHKLYTMGLLDKNPDNTYKLAEEFHNLRSIKIGILTEIFILRGHLIPGFGLLTGFLLGSIILSLILFFVSSPQTSAIFSLVALAVTAGILLHQSIMTYRTLKS